MANFNPWNTIKNIPNMAMKADRSVWNTIKNIPSTAMKADQTIGRSVLNALRKRKARAPTADLNFVNKLYGQNHPIGGVQIAPSGAKYKYTQNSGDPKKADWVRQ